MNSRWQQVRGRFGGPSSHPTRRARIARSAGAVLVAVAFLAPILLLVSGSLHQPGLPPQPRPDLIPDPATTEGYRRAVELGGLARATLNSAIVALIAVPASVLVASLAGFALAQLPRRARAVVIGATLVAIMVPATALLVPRFAIFRTLGLTGTLVPLIVPALLATSPIYVLVYYLAYRGLPTDLYDACRIEDLTPMQTWWRVAFPMVRPVSAAIAALTFVLTWSNFLDPLVYLYDRELFTLPLALRSLATLDPTDFPIFLAAAVLTTIAPLVVFALVQRRFFGFVHRTGRFWL